MIDSLTHTIDQSGARTSGSLKYVRSHRTGDDTDDLFAESITDQAKLALQTTEPVETPAPITLSLESVWSYDGSAPSGNNAYMT